MITLENMRLGALAAVILIGFAVEGHSADDRASRIEYGDAAAWSLQIPCSRADGGTGSAQNS